jgi:DNA-directed RNA polymerase specialized sigma24 family protein
MHGIIVPRSYRALARPTLASLIRAIKVKNNGLESRDQMVIRAQVVHGYTQAEIGRSLGLHPNTISKITRKIRRRHHVLIDVA